MQGFYRIVRHLALAALIVRALLPAGWMPGSAAGQPLVICSVDLPAHPTPDGHDQARHDQCAFAAAPHFAFTPVLAQLAAPRLHGFAAATDRRYAAAIAARFVPGSPRAPPAFA